MGVLSVLQGVLAALLTLAFLGSEVGIRVIARRRGSPGTSVDRASDKGSGAGIVVVYAVLIVLLFTYPIAPVWGYVPLWVRFVGDLLMVLGISIRVWAIRVLGKFFTSIVTIQGGHRLISDGPYRVVRHPSYSGILLTSFGLLLAVGGVLPLVAGAVLLPVCFGYRIRVEEDMLQKGLGQEYTEYMQRTSRLIPGIL